MFTCGHADCDEHPPVPHPAPVGASRQRRPPSLSSQSGAREMPGPGARKRAESWALKSRGLGIPLGQVPRDLIFRLHCPVIESFTSW